MVILFRKIFGLKLCNLKPESNLPQLLSLIIGIGIGFTLSQLMIQSERCKNIIVNQRLIDNTQNISKSIQSNTVLAENYKSHLNTQQLQPSTISSLQDQLYNNTRVLCWVLTGPKNHETKAKRVKETWGNRCNKLIFMSSKEDAELGAVKLPNVKEGRGMLWQKTREAFKYIYENHMSDADWFMKADDDT